MTDSQNNRTNVNVSACMKKSVNKCHGNKREFVTSFDIKKTYADCLKNENITLKKDNIFASTKKYKGILA